MSSSEEGSLSLKDIFFNEQGKFCLPCSAYRGFQYISTQATNSFQNYVAKKGESRASDTAGSLNAADVTKETLPIETNSDKIPGSRTYLKEDPPDVQKLGAASWTFLHAMAAKYPDEPSTVQKQEMGEFLKIFSHVYPCNWCAKDFEKYIQNNSPRVESKEELSRWMCEAHNSVNVKLGKAKFDCNFWKQRWKDGWED